MAETYDPFAFMRAGTPGYTRLGSQFMPAYQARTSFSPDIEMFQPEMLPAPLPPDTRIPEELLLGSIRQMPGGLPTPGVSGGQIPQRAVAPAVDYGKFPLPALPTRPELAPMPTRDLPMERQRTSRASLRAGLIGALLGGGVGAIAGMTGAQQGAQQAFDQDYAQRVAESQDQQRRALQEYQFGTTEYNQRLAALNAMIGREEAQRAAAQQFLDVDYANQVAARNEQLRLEAERLKEAERRGEITKDEREQRIRALSASQYYTDPSAALGFAMTGQLPQKPLTAARSVRRLEPQQARQLVKSFQDRVPFMTNDQYVQERAGLKSVLMDPSNDVFVQNMIKAIPQTRPTGATSAEASRLEIRRLQVENQKKAQDALAQDRDRRYSLSVRRLNMLESNTNSLIAARKAAKAAKGDPKSGPKLTAYQTAANKWVDDINGLIKDRNTAVEKQKQGLLDDDDVAYIQALDSSINASIAQGAGEFEVKPTLDPATNTWTLGKVKVITQPPAGKSKYKFVEVK